MKWFELLLNSPTKPSGKLLGYENPKMFNYKFKKIYDL